MNGKKDCLGIDRMPSVPAAVCGMQANSQGWARPRIVGGLARSYHEQDYLCVTRKPSMTSRRELLLMSLFLGLVAGGLRFYHLGAWPFYGDEVATLAETSDLFENATAPASSQGSRLPRLVPLSYFLHYTGYRLFGWDEWGSRVLLAILGTVQVVLVFCFIDRSLGRPTALLSGLILTFWPEQIFHSQNNRFYLIASFWTGLCMLAGGLALNRVAIGWTVAACVAAFGAIFSHTVQGLALAGLAVALLAGSVAGRQRLPWSVWAVLAAAWLAATVLFFAYLRPLLGRWNEGDTWGVGSLHSVMAAVYQLGWPVALLAGLGALMIVHQRSAGGWYWLSWAGLWAAAAALLPLFVVYNSYYVFPLALAAVVLAGWAAGQVFEQLSRQSRMIAWTWAIVVVAFHLPGLLSHYSDGSRPDYRTAARFIAEHWQPGDQVAAIAPGALRHYADICRQAHSMDSADTVDDLRRFSSTARRLWIVIPIQRSGKPESLRQWLSAHCVQELEIRRPRFDYREFAVEVFLYTAPGTS
jgi:4-amino-4-deoxy-L-arabinose transferase-like glycosyltransferase